jgi:hypothetical protein
VRLLDGTSAWGDGLELSSPADGARPESRPATPVRRTRARPAADHDAGVKLGTIVIGLALLFGGVALAGCGGGGKKTYEPRVAPGLEISPAQQAKLDSMSETEVERQSVRQLMREGRRVLREMAPVVKARHDDPATACPALRGLEDKIWQLDDIVGNLEGIDASAGTRGVVTMRREVDRMIAGYRAADRACKELGY